MIRLAPLIPLSLLVAGCGDAPPAVESNGAAAPAAGAPDNRIDCRPAGATAFTRTCSIDSEGSGAARILTLRKADGGFRRLRVLTDGRGVAAADGAEPAHITLLPDGIEVEIGGDRFRLPARIGTR